MTFKNSKNRFGNKEYVKNYELTRRFGQDASKIIERELLGMKSTPINLLDIGCGTGKATRQVLQMGNVKIKSIDFVDKEERMLKHLRALLSPKHSSISSFHKKNFFDFQTTSLYDAILCSEVIHLIPNLEEFFYKLNKITADNGIIFIRTSTHKQLASRFWYKHFPKCLIIDLERHPSLFLLKAIALNSGFKKFEVMEVDESIEMNSKSYLDFFSKKPFSTLHLISEKDFQDGIARIKAGASGEVLKFDYNMTIYLIKK
jgi:cyclopropane fatty-acyl-phospholipid synthase-like methyltransferase